MSDSLQRRIELANKAFRVGASDYMIFKLWELVAWQAIEENDEATLKDAEEHMDILKKAYNL
jgi:hypothetical protein